MRKACYCYWLRQADDFLSNFTKVLLAATEIVEIIYNRRISKPINSVLPLKFLDLHDEDYNIRSQKPINFNEQTD